MIQPIKKKNFFRPWALNLSDDLSKKLFAKFFGRIVYRIKVIRRFRAVQGYSDIGLSAILPFRFI
jgi:hypothetical protein